MKLLEKLDLLTKQLTTGKQSDETMQSFKMQVAQIKQTINDLFGQEPGLKDTLSEPPNESTLDLSGFTKHLNFL